jgi:heme-degrading monooxygenase HmoA
MVKKEIEKIAIVKCSNYEQKKVDKAVEKALGLIGFEFKGIKKVLKKNGKKVLFIERWESRQALHLWLGCTQ